MEVVDKERTCCSSRRPLHRLAEFHISYLSFRTQLGGPFTAQRRRKKRRLPRIGWWQMMNGIFMTEFDCHGFLNACNPEYGRSR